MIYLDSAATTYLKPKSVIHAMVDYMENSGGNPGRGGHVLSMRAADIIYSCRETLSSLLLCSPEEIVLTPSATFGLNLAIKGTLSAKDHAIITDDAHNSMLRPLNKTCSYSVCSSPDDAISKIKYSTKMLLVNHASNVDGTVSDLDGYIKVAMQYKLLLLVDASQSLGHLNLNCSGIDFIACSGHKGLYGPQGTGFLYVKKGTPLLPIIEGGTGFHSESLTQPSLIPEGLESGTLNGVGFAGLTEGVRFAMKHKNEDEFLMNYLSKEITSIPGIVTYMPRSKETVPVLSFNVKDVDCVKVSEYLSEKHGICTRAGLHCAPLAHRKIGTENEGTVRVSLCSLNTISDIKKLLNAVDNISTKGV